jgi:hypothetical protein
MSALPPLESFRNLHKGERCFLIGNAPSLARLDLQKLEGEPAFSVNRGYLAAQSGLPRATYHLVSDPLTYQPYADEMRAAKVGLRFYRADVFDLPEHLEAADPEPAVRVPFHRAPTMNEGHFAEDASTGLFRGFTVLLDAAQLAFMMGFAAVYVIGCDLEYHAARTHIYGTGAMERERMDVMPVPLVLQSMAVAANAFARHGRVFANAGVGGRLDSIPRVSFDTLFRG